jgi:hypothetical protein
LAGQVELDFIRQAPNFRSVIFQKRFMLLIPGLSRHRLFFCIFVSALFRCFVLL